VPKDVIRRARKYLELLEESAITRGNTADLFAATRTPEPEPAADPLRDELAKVNPDELTPREALELLYRLKQLD
jgi:DNA mismatch repair protein MutS